MKKNRPKYKQIINADVIINDENDYHASQVSKNAKKAGVAEVTIYLYFKNKEDILISVFEEKMGQFIEQIVYSTNKKDNASEKLLTLIEEHFHQLAEDLHLAIVTQLELRQSNTDLRLTINKVLKPYLDVIDEIIEEGKVENIFRENLNTPLVRQMIFGTLDETVTNWVMKDQKYNLEKLATEVHALITSGISKK